MSLQAKAIQRLIAALCSELRGVAVPLVDAFAIPDHILRAPIGLRWAAGLCRLAGLAGWTGRLDWLEDKLWRLLDFTCVGIPPTPLHSHTPPHHHPPLPRPRPFLPAAPRLWTPTTSISQPLASMSEPRYPEPLACELSAPALASAASSSSFWAAPHHQQTDPPGMHACC